MDFLKLLESIRTPFGNEVIALITHLGAETLFMLLSLVFFWCIDKFRGYYLLVTGFCGTVFVQILKMAFRIPRPWILDSHFTIVESAREGATGYSFPSGHTQCATNLYGGIARSSKYRAVQISGIALVILIAFSRMYLGVHTPKDVLVSLAIGIAMVLIFYPLVERSRKDARIMYALIAFCAIIALSNLLFVELYRFPADVDAVNLTDAREVAWKMLAAVVGICVVFPLDQKYIKFETKAVWWAQILKLVGGFALIVLIKSLLKSPLNALLGAEVGGFVRYFLMVLAAGAAWPLTFRWFGRLGKTTESPS